MYHPEGDTHAVPFPVAVSMMTHIPLFQILLSVYLNIQIVNVLVKLPNLRWISAMFGGEYAGSDCPEWGGSTFYKVTLIKQINNR